MILQAFDYRKAANVSWLLERKITFFTFASASLRTLHLFLRIVYT